MARAIHPVVVGTAGHIDHGKSSLVKALTGIDPDRLKEEKERGLTIDLGFARLKLSDGRWLGMVDVPGHERFVRNMVAGCTGLDLAILVVAADDGVMPQTIEHIDILDLLGVRGGLVALTKVDMVDPALADMAEDEVRKVLRDTVLDGVEICRVSSVTGEGLPELKQKLEALALAVEPRQARGPFRMPIQRVFTLPGIGTVVTGIPVSGSVRPGDEVEILPLGEKLKVRGLHAYGGKVDEAVAGHSTALSVPDAKETGVHRGMIVGAPGVFATGDAVDVALVTTRRSPVLHHREPIRFHTGTVEVRGELLLLDRDTMGPSDQVTVRVELDDDVCCAHGDRFLLRLQNPAVTVGGGTVLRLGKSGRYRRKDLGVELQGIVAAGDRPEARIDHELNLAGPDGRGVDDLARALECEDGKVLATLATMPHVHLHQRAMRAFLLAGVDAGEREVLDSVDKMLARRSAAASIKRTALRTTKTLPQPLIEAVLDRLQAAGRVRAGSQGQILFVERLRPLPPVQHQQLERIVAFCEARRFKPPELAEIEAEVGLTGDALQGLLDRAQDEARLEKVVEHWWGARMIRSAMRSIRANCLRHAEVLEIPELRDEFDTSRKYLIPLLEHVDALGLTVLRGGVRRLLSTSDLNRELAREAAGAG
ncbi:MAG: selenocysteine-specific translation elongation factor [Planctomycetes bacterium]|nr:selenocysteine-specific translation elongation factor [Planctomycetota bacterium]